MVGKLITKGLLRSIAIRKMTSALDGLLIEGLKTNIPLHKVIVRNKNFLAGNYSTAFIETEKPQDKVDLEVNYLDIYKKLAAIEARRIGI